MHKFEGDTIAHQTENPSIEKGLWGDVKLSLHMSVCLPLIWTSQKFSVLSILLCALHASWATQILTNIPFLVLVHPLSQLKPRKFLPIFVCDKAEQLPPCSFLGRNQFANHIHYMSSRCFSVSPEMNDSEKKWDNQDKCEVNLFKFVQPSPGTKAFYYGD